MINQECSSLKDILRCPLCLNNLSLSNGYLECVKCQKKYEIANNKIFFSNYEKDDSLKSKEIKSHEKKKWTILRKLQFSFLEQASKDFNLKGHWFLDVGAGPGQFNDLFKDFTNKIAIDFNAYDNVDIISNLENYLPFQDSQFDCVLSANVFEHIYTSNFLLNGINRILKPNSALIGVVPFMLEKHQEPYDFYRFTDFALERLLKDSNFSDIKIIELGRSFDTYKVSQEHFYRDTLDDLRKLPVYVRYFSISIIKILWNIEKVINFIFRRIFYKAKKGSKSPLGYGFIAYKK